MKPNRLPRFKRVVRPFPIQLTQRDQQIIQLVHRHRFLRSRQIVALVGGSSQHLLRRLQALFHHGYLERPRAQIDYYHEGGFRHVVYGLGTKGAAILKKESGLVVPDVAWSEKNNSVKRVFLEHALLVSDIMVALELACRRSGSVTLHTENDLNQTSPQQFRWKVSAVPNLKLGVIPDCTFALEFKNHNGGVERAFFFLEADRGTMPVNRTNLSQTSFFRKLLGYEATWMQSIHWKRFGFHRFRVLTITTIPARVNSLVEACSKLERGRGLFIFGDETFLQKPQILVDKIWRTGNGQLDSLLD